MELLELASAFEAADRESDSLFERAFWAVNPNYADIRRFRELLDAKAYLDAAMMLVPEGCDWELTSTSCARLYQPYAEAAATTPALALTAASLKALAEQEEG